MLNVGYVVYLHTQVMTVAELVNNLFTNEPSWGLTQFMVMLAFMTQYPTSELPENYSIQWREEDNHWLIWETGDYGVIWQAQVEYHGRSKNRKTFKFRVFHDAYKHKKWHTILVPSDYLVVKQINGGA